MQLESFACLFTTYNKCVHLKNSHLLRVEIKMESNYAISLNLSTIDKCWFVNEIRFEEKQCYFFTARMHKSVENVTYHVG